MDAHRFIQNLIGSLIPNNDHPMDDAQMPPLEPIIHNQPSTSHSTSNLAAAEAPETPADDVHMQPAQSRSRTHNDNEEDADSMPDLQSVSNSSDEESSDSDDESGRDANEVEMQAVQDDDNDSAWTDEDDDMPGLERINVEPAPAGQRRTNRRPRVEDDQDDERDRRHPSQRVADTMSINEPPPSTVPSTGTATPVPAVPQLPLPQPLNPTQNGPSPTNQPTPGPLPPIPPHMLFRIPLARFRATTQNAPGNANNNNNNNNTNNANNNANANFTGQPMIGGFAITIDNNGMPVLHAHPPHQHAHPDGNGNGDPNAEPQAPGGGGLPQDLSALFNLFGNAIGIGFGEREQEDPERAKRLVDALEEVPVGLVRRLGRVGGGQLAGEEGAGVSGGDGGCAICWDSLLDGDLKGEGWTTTKKDGIAGEAATEVTPGAEAGANPILESSTSADTVVEASSSSDSVWKEAKSSAENESKSNSEPEQPKIVSMPCAHVFHAACLIPWFSRPRQTTCPTCRFNIDPENLTYVRRRAPAPPNGGNNGNAVPGMGVAQTQTQGGEQAHPQARDVAQPPHTLHAAGLRLPTPAGFNPGGVGPIPTNANAGGDPNPNNPPQFFAFSPEHFEQASRDILADTRVELAASIASAQAARDNALAPSAPGTNTLDDPRSGNVAAAAALERAETSLARVEQWLDRVGMAGGLLTRLGAGVLHGQGLGQRLGPDANTGANENVGTTPDADVTATANNVNAEGGETANGAPAGAPAITTAILLDRLAALETAIGRVTDLSNALAPTANAEATPANAEAPPAPGVNAGPGAGAPPHVHIPPNNNGPGMGFVTFGFDVIIGANGNMDADGEGMMDGNGGEGDMMVDDDRWVPIPVMVADDVRDGPGGNEDELPPLEPIQGLHPAPLQSNAATARNNDNNINSTPSNAPTAAPNQNPNAHFQPFGMGNMGPGVHVATGTGRTLNEAMASLFGGWGQDQGQQQQQHPGGEGQGVPQQQAQAQGGVPPHAGDGPPTQPATPVDENGLGAQNGVGPGGVPTMQNFFSALLGSVPQGGVGRINPISVGGRGAANPGPGQGQNQGQDAPLPQPAGTQANPGIPAPPNANPGNNNNVDWEQFFPLPPFQPGEVNGNGAQAGLPPFTALFGNGPAAMPQAHAPPHPHAHAHMHAHPPFMSMPGMGPRRAPREKKAWTLPPPPGPTLRQRVERKEREAGMRCHDLSCGVGPSDDEPLMAKTDTMMNQLSIHPLTKGLSTEVCAHMFHTSCLVSSERVALMGELPTATGEDVEVSCPVCRVAGCISKASWDEGVQALA